LRLIFVNLPFRQGNIFLSHGLEERGELHSRVDIVAKGEVMVRIKAHLLFIVAAAGAVLGFPGSAHAVPSYARQTGMACQACHTVFPELTPFGRSFKLNGYQIDNLPQVQGISQSKEYELLLNQVPPFSFMWQTSYTSTKKAQPDSAGIPDANAQNGQILFPQQASLFYSGRIAPGLGSFVQITYDSAEGTVHWDNTELRYAQQASLLGTPLTWGLTMNNNPTVQDPWNSTPAWQTPFDQRSNAAPVPGAATHIDGTLGGSVAGLTGYLWWKNSVYAEYGFYRSSPQGFKTAHDQAGPLDSAAGDLIAGYAPYWRIAYEHQWDRNSLTVGAYGIDVKISPVGSIDRNRFRDTALDGQYQFIGDEHIFSAQTTYIRERQRLDGAVALGTAENTTNDLKTFRAGGSYYYRRTYGGAFGYFSTSGSSDAMLYASGTPVFGFANNSPNSNGWIGEVAWVPYQNVKLLVQYVAYDKFNGAKNDYDGSGRNAKDNNTLYVLGWLAF
jgi:hypothetical protein